MISTFFLGVWYHKLLITSIFISLVLLCIFLISQDNDAKILALEVKWLLVSGVPIALGLLIGGYIKTFKGFGVELESNLNEPVPPSVISRFETIASPSMDKESVMRLQHIPQAELNKITRLKFVVGKPHYYTEYAIGEHLRLLKNLRYLELTNLNGEFLYLIPLAKLKVEGRRQPDYIIEPDRVRRFIEALERGFLGEFAPFAVSDSVTTSHSTIEVYRRLKNSSQVKVLDKGKRMLPALDEEKVMIGLVELTKVAEIIADDVERSLDR